MSSPWHGAPATPRQRRNIQPESPIDRKRRQSLSMQNHIERLGQQQADLMKVQQEVVNCDGATTVVLPPEGQMQGLHSNSVVEPTIESQMNTMTKSVSNELSQSPEQLRRRRRRNVLILIALLVIVFIILLIINPTVTSMSASDSEAADSSALAALTANRQVETTASGAIKAYDVIDTICFERLSTCEQMSSVDTGLDNHVLVEFDESITDLQVELDALAESLLTTHSALVSIGIVSMWIRNADVERLVCVPEISESNVLCGTTRPIGGCQSEGSTGAKCLTCLSGYFGSLCEKCGECAGITRCNDGVDGDGECTDCPSGFAGTDCADCASGYYGSACLGQCECSDFGTCADGRSGDGWCTCQTGWTGTLCTQCEQAYYGSACNTCVECVNGVCDDGLDGSGQCRCEDGWSGRLCSVGNGDDTALDPSDSSVSSE